MCIFVSAKLNNMRTVSLNIENKTGIAFQGKCIEKYVSSQVKMISVDGLYSITQQSFIQKLATSNRIDWSFYTKHNQNFSDEFISKLLNENSDLFPSEI